MKSHGSFLAAGFGAVLAIFASQATAAVTGTIDPVSGFQTTSAPITYSYVDDDSKKVRVADGTTAYSATILVNGKTRRYVVIRPMAAVSNPAVLLLMHPHGTAPETTAEVTEISDYVLTQGFWAVLPEALGRAWDNDPSKASNEDVPFISALINTLIGKGADGTRIYASGFSNGGFMAERLACELSDKIAAFGIDAATLHGSQASSCAPTRQRSKIYFLGTADFVVPYDGIFSGGPNGLWSAEDTMNYWVGKQGCGGVVATTLPDRVSDGTTVQKTDHTGCTAGTALQLYTVYGGGHTWPGGKPTYTGKVTKDIQASGLIWRFVSPFRR